MFEEGVDLVALCEVDAAALAAIREQSRVPSYMIPIAEKVGKSRWDLGVLHRHRLDCRKLEPTIYLNRGSTVRAAYSVEVRPAERDPFRLYLLHWRSRLSPDGSSYREEAAQALRRRVEGDLQQGTRVVVMGDFNDEPFDSSLESLRTSRDPRFVLEYPKQFLFNLSWCLSAPPRNDVWGTFGTFPYRGGRNTMQYLYDQALVSAHFLNDTDGPPLRARVWGELNSLGQPDSRTVVDHRPLEVELP